MPKLKKAPKNAYFFFITKRREEMEAQGYRVGNFQNASMSFGHEWSQMTKEDKAPFELMAKEAKEEEKYNVNNKFTVTGESYAQVHQKVMEQKSAQTLMDEFIRSLTSGQNAKDRMYIFMKTVYSVEQIVDKKTRAYWPMELSLAAFSLRGGLKAIYTTLIDTEEAPVGYRSQAKENCEESLIPMPGDPSYSDTCRDYLQIVKNISGFASHWLKDGYEAPDHRHVFFSLDSEKEAILSGIQWMVNKLEGRNREKYQRFVDNLQIYKLSKLILSMAEEASLVNPSYKNYLVDFKLESAAEAVISKGNYDYREEIACPYHKSDMASMKMHNCAQSIVMRRIFMLFEEFVPAYEFQWMDRHRIDKVGKGSRGPMVKKKKEELPEEEVKSEEPAWLKPDPKKSSWFTDDQPSTSDDTGTDFAPWGKRSAAAASFVDDDFPSLGGGSGRGKSSSTSSQSPPQRMPYSGGGGRGRGGPPTSISFDDDDDDDDFPALGSSSSSGRGRGRY